MTRVTLAGAVVAVTAAAAVAGEPAQQNVQSELEALKQRVQQQEQQLQELRSQSADSWLSERRKEEVRSLVQDVMADAETRASFQEGGLTAGHNGDHFFIGSEDGNFEMEFMGHVQVRYIYNQNDDPARVGETREDQEGFQIPRAKFGVYGHIYDPALTYGLRLAADAGVDTRSPGGNANAGVDDGDAELEEAFFGYEFAEGWQVKGGQFKGPFLREELVYSAHQLAAERSLVNDIFTIDYTQGLQASYESPMWRAAAMIHDGSYAANTDFDAGPGLGSAGVEAEFALAGRAEVLVAGDWEQFEDFQAWSGDSLGVMVGAGADYENAEHQTAATPADVLKWTVDASVEVPEMAGFNAFGALMGRHTDANDFGTDVDQYGAVVQAGVFVIPDRMDAFGRWEWLDTDGQFAGTPDKVNLLTAGTNYYLQGNNARATLDAVWVMDENIQNFGVTNYNGLLGSQDEDEVAVRAQFQMLF